MIEIDRYRPDDRGAIGALHRKVLGDERAEALGRRWDWLYHGNPNLANGEPLVWLARDGTAIVGQIATLPVRLRVNGEEIDAAWGTDAMVAPEGQRKGLGTRLYSMWEHHFGAALALSMTDASHALFTKHQWRHLGRLPRFVKRLTARSDAASGGIRRRLGALSRPIRSMIAARRPLGGEVRRVDAFDDSFDRLWERVAPKFAFAVRRDAAYLTWKFQRAPDLGYAFAALTRHGETTGFVVYRHVTEPERRLTLIVDFLADPDDPRAMAPLLRWIDREARAARSDVIRVFTTNAGFHGQFRAAGYEAGPPGMRFAVKIEAVPLPPTFYDSLDRWHITGGDSDADQ